MFVRDRQIENFQKTTENANRNIELLQKKYENAKLGYLVIKEDNRVLKTSL